MSTIPITSNGARDVTAEALAGRAAKLAAKGAQPDRFTAADADVRMSGRAHETPMADFPIEILPAPLRNFTIECARVTKVPVSLPAACCLAVASAAIGSRLRVRSISGKLSSGNIMVLAAAETGTGKSEVHRECLSPFEECQREVIETWKDQILPEAKAEVRLLKKEIKRLEDREPEEAEDRAEIRAALATAELKLTKAEARTMKPVYRASDFTTPELIRILCRMDGQLFAASPDAKNFVDMVLGRYNDGGTDEEVYLKAFSLETIDRHRVSDGSQETPEACITGLWLTQPDKLARLLAERALSEGGLLPRLLMLEVSCPPLRVSVAEKGINATARDGYVETIRALFSTLRRRNETQEIEAHDDARRALVEYHNTVADRREYELRDVTGFAARWGEYAWRLALVCHASRLGVEAAMHPLTLTDANAGIALSKWFANQQLSVLQAGRMRAQNARHAEVLKLFNPTKQRITSRDVYRANITPRGQAEVAESLLKEMETAGLLTHEDRPTDRKNHTQRAYSKA